MEEEAQNLLATLKKSTVAVDTKLVAFNNLKSNIKHQRVPETCQPAIFECIRIGIAAQTSPTLVTAAFATLGHLIKRLSLQEQASTIAAQTPKLLPILQDRLADAREALRNASSSILSDLWPYSKEQVEKVIREGAMGGTSARSKEMAMLWVVKMNRTDALPFKSFVPSLVACLEDSDGGVRETAKSCVVELFRSAPERAKADLKKQMISHDVRKTIVSFITQHLDIRGPGDTDLAASTTSHATTSTNTSHSVHNMNESTVSEHPPQESTALDPIYVHTQRELEESFREMQPAFEGRETEHNWLPRDKSIRKIRGLLQGNAPTDFHAAFMAGIMAMRDNILKVTNTLRTTMSTNGCQLVQELYQNLGSSMDPMTEIILQNFIKMSAATKNIAAKNADTTMEIILSNCTFNHRLLHHIWLTFGEKNMQTRSFAPGWLKLIMKKNASHKAHVEHSGGIDMIEKCLKRGLEDASPKVRESTRSAYWLFAQIWPEHGESFLNGLEDNKMRTALEKDPNNPNKTSLASSTSSLGGGKGKAGQVVRPSIRDAIAAQRKSAIKNLPDRPNSAQSTFSTSEIIPGPVRSGASRAPARPPSALSKPVEAPQAAKPGLTSGPARRPRRPEINRPATADPYATRKPVSGPRGTPTLSPQVSPGKGASSSRQAVPSQSRTIGRTPVRPTGTPGAASTVRNKPRGNTMPKSSPGGIPSLPSSPDKDENMTLVVPFTQPPDDTNSHALPNIHSRFGQIHSPASTMHSSEEDTGGFTMVLPTLAKDNSPLRNPPSRPSSSGTPTKSHLPVRSPVKHGNENRPLLGSATTSPVFNRKLPSPNKVTQSPQRHIEDVFTDQGEGGVQVYEDPFESEHGLIKGRTPGKSVLEEIPVNERTPEIDSTLNTTSPSKEDGMNSRRLGHLKTASTGSELDQSPGQNVSSDTLRSRRLLASAIDRVRAKTLDAHGFRKVQELVKSSGANSSEVWGDAALGTKSLYGELLLSLLEYLESPAEDLKVPGAANSGSAKVLNLKTQVLGTVRAMLALPRKEVQAFSSRALCAIIRSRKGVDEMSYLAADMERLAEEITKTADAGEALDDVLDLVDDETKGLFPGSPALQQADLNENQRRKPFLANPAVLTMALGVLGKLLATMAVQHVDISPLQTKRLGGVAVRLLQDPNSEVRRADLEFCLELHERLGGENGEGFWNAVEGWGVRESGVNLIMYYLAKRGKASRST